MSEQDRPLGEQKLQDTEALLSVTEHEISLIDNAQEAIGGPEANIDDVFPIPPEVRNNAHVPDWDKLQIQEGRRLGEELGFGSEFDQPTDLENHVAIVAGGKVWKMLAEEQSMGKEKNPSDVVYAGTIYYSPADDERQMLIDQEVMTEEEMAELDADSSAEIVEGKEKRFTQYDFAVWLAKRRVAKNQAQGAEPIEPTVLPFGYEVAAGNPFVESETGQLSAVGMNDGQSVMTLRADRENYINENGEPKYRYQPNPEDIMRFISSVLTATGSDKDVGLMEANAYAGRKIDARKAGLDNGRRFDVNLYGRDTMARVKGADIEPAGPKLNQLPGSIREYHDKSLALQEMLQEKTDSI